MNIGSASPGARFPIDQLALGDIPDEKLALIEQKYAMAIVREACSTRWQIGNGDRDRMEMPAREFPKVGALVDIADTYPIGMTSESDCERCVF